MATQYLMFFHEFQSTLPVRGATLQQIHVVAALDISIHAPREGSDLAALIRFAFLQISIHAPREGSDCKNTQKRICIFGKEYNFYSRQLF